LYEKPACRQVLLTVAACHQFILCQDNQFLQQATKETAGGGLTKNQRSDKNNQLAATY